MDKKKNYNIEILRAVATIMVITIHVSGKFIYENIAIVNNSFTIGNFYNAISRVCVPIFIMISGGFILNNKKNSEFKYFYKKIFRRIVIPTIIWSFVYFIYNIFLWKIYGSPNIFGNISSWFLGEPFYHLWYLYMMIGMYFITPFLIKFINHIGERKSKLLGIIFFLLGILLSLIGVNLFWPFKFISYLGYYIFGHLIKLKYEIHKANVSKFFIIAILSGLIVFIATELSVRGIISIKNKLYFYGDLSPFVILGSSSLYSAFLNVKSLRINLNIISKNSFNIYLVHAGILSIISIIVNEILNLDYGSDIVAFIYIPVVVLIVLIVSCYISINIDKNIMKFKLRLTKYKSTLIDETT